MEIQAAGYLTLEVAKQYAGPFPRWVVTNVIAMYEKIAGQRR